MKDKDTSKTVRVVAVQTEKLDKETIASLVGAENTMATCSG